MTRQRMEENIEGKTIYPFALVLRLRVLQVVCGISTLLMGAVALIEEKTPFNLGLGLPAGLSTVVAAATNIYSSRGFDGYEPSACKTYPSWLKCRVFGPTYKHAVANVLLWSLATLLQTYLFTKTTNVIFFKAGLVSGTITALASIELLLILCIAVSVAGVVWIDCNYDPDYQEPPDLAHSNTGTAVSMVTLSQAAANV